MTKETKTWADDTNLPHKDMLPSACTCAGLQACSEGRGRRGGVTAPGGNLAVKAPVARRLRLTPMGHGDSTHSQTGCEKARPYVVVSPQNQNPSLRKKKTSDKPKERTSYKTLAGTAPNCQGHKSQERLRSDPSPEDNRGQQGHRMIKGASWGPGTEKGRQVGAEEV